MYLERWVEHPSDTETWLVNGCLLLTVSRREVIELVTGTFEEFLLLRLAPLAFLSVPVHDTENIEGIGHEQRHQEAFRQGVP